MPSTGGAIATPSVARGFDHASALAFADGFADVFACADAAFVFGDVVAFVVGTFAFAGDFAFTGGVFADALDVAGDVFADAFAFGGEAFAGAFAFAAGFAFVPAAFVPCAGVALRFVTMPRRYHRRAPPIARARRAIRAA